MNGQRDAIMLALKIQDGPRAGEYQQPLEARKGKEKDYLPGAPERNSCASILILAQ